jgi:hypothetical protein
MTGFVRVVLLSSLGQLLLQCPLLGQTASPQLCASTVVILVNQFTFQRSLLETARVELRRCGESVSENLQIVAWETGASKPTLIVDTTDFTVVQTAARQNIYVIETTGGPRDRVFVVLYEQGKPVLKLQRVTRGTARITLSRDNLELVIPDIYNGDAPPRTETYRYALE